MSTYVVMMSFTIRLSVWGYLGEYGYADGVNKYMQGTDARA